MRTQTLELRIMSSLGVFSVLTGYWLWLKMNRKKLQSIKVYLNLQLLGNDRRKVRNLSVSGAFLTYRICRRFGDNFERRARLVAFAIGSFEGFSPLGATRASASGFGL